MSINVYNIEQAILDKMNSSSTELELLEYSKMLTQLKTGIVQVVDTYASLPAAASSTGHLYYVQDEKTIYWANAANGWITLQTQSLNKIFGMGCKVWFGAGTGQIPSPVQESCSFSVWSDLSITNQTTLAIKSDGTLWGTGNRNCGILYSPFQSYTGCVTSFVSACYNDVDANWSCVSAGYNHSHGVKKDGTLWGWGNNDTCGSLAVGSSVLCNYSSPVKEISSSTNWSKVYATRASSSAIKTDGTLWGWGYNNVGQLGLNSNSCPNSPVQEITSSTNWCAVATSWYTRSAIKTDGTLWSSGRNSCGELGTNDTDVGKSSPTQEISSSTNWCGVSLRAFSSTAIKTDGTLWVWGNGDGGRLGRNSLVCYSSPVQEITSSTNWSILSKGEGYYSNVHSAIKADGTLWSWGTNNQGQLGDGTTFERSSPVQEITSSTDWTLISRGSGVQVGLKTTTL